MCSRLWLKFIFDAARAHPTLVPLAVYDRAACGYSEPGVPMIGFVMYEIDCGVGSILRVMIDRAHQRKGYGRAALLEVVRHDNAVAASVICPSAASAGDASEVMTARTSAAATDGRTVMTILPRRTGERDRTPRYEGTGRRSMSASQPRAMR